MTASRDRPLAFIVLAMVLSLPGGGLIGVLLARAVAPASMVADAVGLFMLPLAFTVGLQLWLGTAILTAVAQLVRRLTTGGTWRAGPASDAQVPSGSFAFVPVSATAGFLGGIVVGLVSGEYSFLACVMIYTIVGAAYGIAVWQLARGGYLPFPEHGL